MLRPGAFSSHTVIAISSRRLVSAPAINPETRNGIDANRMAYASYCGVLGALELTWAARGPHATDAAASVIARRRRDRICVIAPGGNRREAMMMPNSRRRR